MKKHLFNFPKLCPVVSLSFYFGYKTNPDQETTHFPFFWFAWSPFAFSICILGFNLIINHDNIKYIRK